MQFRSLLTLISLFFLLQLNGQNVELTCKLNGCSSADSLYLFTFKGIGVDKVDAAAPGEDHIYTFTLKGDGPAFYYLGLDTRKFLPIIVGPEEKVYVEAQCRNIRAASFSVNSINRKYRDMMDQVRGFQKQSNKLMNSYRSLAYNNKDVSPIVNQMDTLDAQKTAYLAQLESTDPFLRDVAALFVNENYPNNLEKYGDELTYLKESFLNYADLSEPVYRELPHIYETFKSYASTISRTGIDEETQRDLYEHALARIPKGTQAYSNALGGIINGLKSKASKNYVHYGKAFIASNEDTPSKYLYSVIQTINKMEALLPGRPAPEFTMQSPEGEDVSLADFEGKVLLLDFWASWCGPCRRENPNVVRVYNKYKDRGFEILGISLDHKRDAWLKAIEKDGLEWVHVSDLKGWKNTVAKQYAVSSIPHTVLIDEQGRILASRLRGHQLDQFLGQYFKAE